MDVESSFLTALHDSPRNSAFRDAVYSFTDALKEDGEPVERVIIRLKHLIAGAPARSRWGEDFRDSPRPVEDITAIAVRCCIERFFPPS